MNRQKMFYFCNTPDCTYHYNFIPKMTLRYVNDNDPKLNYVIYFMKFSFEKERHRTKTD